MTRGASQVVSALPALDCTSSAMAADLLPNLTTLLSCAGRLACRTRHRLPGMPGGNACPSPYGLPLTQGNHAVQV